MAYSNSVKEIVKRLHQEKYSANSIQKILDDPYNLDRCRELGIDVTQFVKDELTKYPHSYTTICRWFKEESALPPDFGSPEPREDTPHKQKMRKLAGELRGRIALPPVSSVFSFMDAESGKVNSGRYPYYCGDNPRGFTVTSDSEVLIDPVIPLDGSDGHLWKGLVNHLETGGFPDVVKDIDQWQGLFTRYMQQRLDFVQGVAESQMKTVCYLRKDQAMNNEHAGHKIEFITSACADAVQMAADNKVENRSLGYCVEPLSREPFLLLIRYNHGGIYVAGGKDEAEKARAAHETLRLKLSKGRDAKQLARLHSELADTGNQIRNRLQSFPDMERVPGYCNLCC